MRAFPVILLLLSCAQEPQFAVNTRTPQTQVTRLRSDATPSHATDATASASSTTHDVDLTSNEAAPGAPHADANAQPTGPSDIAAPAAAPIPKRLPPELAPSATVNPVDAPSAVPSVPTKPEEAPSPTPPVEDALPAAPIAAVDAAPIVAPSRDAATEMPRGSPSMALASSEGGDRDGSAVQSPRETTNEEVYTPIEDAVPINSPLPSTFVCGSERLHAVVKSVDGLHDFKLQRRYEDASRFAHAGATRFCVEAKDASERRVIIDNSALRWSAAVGAEQTALVVRAVTADIPQVAVLGLHRHLGRTLYVKVQLGQSSQVLRRGFVITGVSTEITVPNPTTPDRRTRPVITTPDAYCQQAGRRSGTSAGGDGSASSPYLICTPEQLRDAARNFSGSKCEPRYVKLRDSLSFESLGGIAPITAGCLHIDGANFAIRNAIVAPDANGGGLFGEVRGSLRNLTLENIKVQMGLQANIAAGIIASSVARGAMVQNIAVRKSSIHSQAAECTGGAVGRVLGRVDSVWVESYSNPETSTSITSMRGKNVGGIAGCLEAMGYAEASITNSYADVYILEIASAPFTVGGIVGSSYSLSSATRNYEPTVLAEDGLQEWEALLYNNKAQLTLVIEPSSSAANPDGQVGGIAGRNSSVLMLANESRGNIGAAQLTHIAVGGIVGISDAPYECSGSCLRGALIRNLAKITINANGAIGGVVGSSFAGGRFHNNDSLTSLISTNPNTILAGFVAQSHESGAEESVFSANGITTTFAVGSASIYGFARGGGYYVDGKFLGYQLPDASIRALRFPDSPFAKYAP